MFARIIHIVKKDIVVDLRGRFSLTSSMLYLVAVVFVLHKIFNDASPPVRIGLFWVILLFTAISLVSHSFSDSSRRRKLSHYQLYDPYELITAKLILNYLKILFAGGVLYFLQAILLDQGTKDPWLLVQIILLAGLGMSGILTLVASVTSYSDDKAGLVSILGLPLLIPVLLLAMRLSLVAERILLESSSDSYLLMLAGIDLLLVTLVVVFFPVIWKS